MPPRPKKKITPAEIARRARDAYLNANDTVTEAVRGAGEGALRTLGNLVTMPYHLLQSATAYTPEELRDPQTQEVLREQGRDPVAMLHEALRARGRGEPIGGTETLLTAGKGLLTMGYDMQTRLQDIMASDASASEKGDAFGEYLTNIGLLGLGGGEVPRTVGGVKVPPRISGLLRKGGVQSVEDLAELQNFIHDAAPRVQGPAVPPQELPFRALPDRPSLFSPTPAEPARPINPALRGMTVGGSPVVPVGLADIRRAFRSVLGGDEPLPKIKAVDEPAARRMADTYEGLKSDPASPEVIDAYEAFTRETQAQANALKRAGYTWEFVTEDPYPPTKGGSKAMLRDLRENRHIRVYKTTGEQAHPLMTNEQNNLFRAVHEILGHGVDEVSFSAIGEENAFRSHAQMYSPKARRVMTTETRGQNSQFNYGPNRHIPAPERPFAQQKAALWPTEMMGDYSTFPKLETPPVWNESPMLKQARERGVVTPDRLVPSVKGVNGQFYSGINHQDAIEAAASAIRSNPEWRALAEKKHGGMATTGRSDDGFRLGDEHVSREHARFVARERGQAPKLAPEYTQLHSSDLGDITVRPSEHRVPDPAVNPRQVGPDTPAPTGLPRSERGAFGERPDLEGFMGTGKDSYTPEDLAGLRIFGRQQAAPNIIIPRASFDPRTGAPQLGEMIRRYGQPESGSILDYVDPGTHFKDVPQTEFGGLPSPKSAGEFFDRYQQARSALNMDNPYLMDAIRRGTDMGYPWWYNAEPIFGSALEHLGPALAPERFNMLADFMKPTSVQTSPMRNVRNASYQYYRTGNPDAPQYAPGYRPIYTNPMTELLDELSRGGGTMSQPKIEPYGQAFKGDWGTAAGDQHLWRAMRALGVRIPRTMDPGVSWRPVQRALADFAHDIQGEGLIPEVAGRSPVSPTQATIWGGMGKFTGVEGLETARPTIWQMFEDAAHRGSRHLGMAPDDFLRGFWNREHPLF